MVKGEPKAAVVMRRPSINLQIVPAQNGSAVIAAPPSPIVAASPPRPSAQPLRTIKKVTKIRYGSDFCGFGTFSLALKQLLKGIQDVGTEHAFACDWDKHCRDITNYVEKPTILDGNIMTRDMDTLPTNMSLYSLTAPCQALSPAGNGLGAADPRTRFIWKGVEVVEKKLPRAFIMENSSALAQFAKHANFYRALKRRLRNAGNDVGLNYILKDAVLNSSRYVPQNRSRTYLVGIRSDTIRYNAVGGVDIFPNPPAHRLFSMADIVVPLTTDWKMLPDDPAKAKRVANAVRQAQLHGTNAFIEPVIIDTGASDKFATFRIAEVPAITRTRAQTRNGYWCSTKGGHLTVLELAMLQGFPREFIEGIKNDLNKKDNVIGACVGNAQTLPLLADLIAHVLYMSKTITKEQFVLMKLNVEKMKPF